MKTFRQFIYEKQMMDEETIEENNRFAGGVAAIGKGLRSGLLTRRK
jgi:hypothetical protein